MMIYKNISLKKYNTFGLNYRAECLIKIRTEKEATALFNGTIAWKKPLLILGSGSNILFTSDYKGTILYPELGGIRIEEKDISSGYVIMSAGAGLNWDDFVAWSVNKGFGGLENLSLIPGKVGAASVQNIGAYGVEVKDQIIKVKTVNINNGSIRIFTNDECEFSYRNSIFKNREKGNYLVTRVYFRLLLNPTLKLSYGSLKEEVSKLGAETLKNVRQGVINIRRSKLPDPEITGNAGSFFKNPVVKETVAEKLKKEYPDMPVYKDDEGYTKLASGWLIDRCGWKGKRTGDAGVHDKQALVLVNYGKATGNEIYKLSEDIKKSVLEKFGVNLEREVEVIGVI
ncbi:MAG: UDP-N-acetylmuramate dehydrogenase [Bacteroidales bacterium]